MSKSYVIDEDVARQQQAAFKSKCDDAKATGQKLLARIRRSSKYFGQGIEGKLIPVAVTAEGDYCVAGGPGGQYRLLDVDLFAVFDAYADPIQITFE